MINFFGVNFSNDIKELQLFLESFIPTLRAVLNVLKFYLVMLQ